MLDHSGHIEHSSEDYEPRRRGDDVGFNHGDTEARREGKRFSITGWFVITATIGGYE